MPEKKDPKKKTPDDTVKKPAKSSSKKVVKPKKKTKPDKSSMKDLAKVLSLMEKDDRFEEYRNTVNIINSKLYEHLSCFIVIGYTEDGAPVNITSAQTPKDYDALSTCLQKYVLDILPSDPPGPPGSHP